MLLLLLGCCRLLCGVFLEGCARVGLEDAGAARLLGSGRLRRSCTGWLILLVRNFLLGKFLGVGRLCEIAPVGWHLNISVNLGLEGHFLILFIPLLLSLLDSQKRRRLLMIEESFIHVLRVFISLVQITMSHHKGRL